MRNKKPYISIIIPVHNEEANLEWHHKKIEKTLASLPIRAEVIYVDDGSRDNSMALIKKMRTKYKSISFISFSKNFGKEAAITAGLKKARGDAALIIDADGQHPIELLNVFISKWHEGYDVVSGIRESNEGEGVIKATGSKLFYTLLRIVDNSREAIPNSTDFRLIDRKVIDQYNALTERNRITRNLIDWLGFKRATVPFQANARHAGAAAYSYTKLVKLAVDGAIKHSTKPLKFIGVLGITTSFISLFLMVFLLIENYLLHDPLNLAVSGTAVLAILLGFLIGIVLSCQGLLALYIENVYHETQNRPLYIISEEE
jgi:dolichol-phosphate mannosyltransferase